ncbi:hypothetical protein STCU_07908 [Strigomonas culicis]|uniref:Uncharacterized protein n=1 Tax=Strigomonas culicis TaxID=28005 RepID=S9VIJ1_9TRYP|nr:hypothetical protein STCU_07908 [Strigomonas culicis]|eukprot:EPY23050.1 hypothetical protein STCU_07908 [Strigomonas culicis]
MLRSSLMASVATAAVALPLTTQRRHVRYANISETLKPTPGQSAGQLSILNEICCNPDAEEQRRKPVFRAEVAPTAAAANGYLRAMYQWGYDSLTLFKKTNEDPGPWWNANSSTLVSNWSQVGDYANAGMWSNVWRYTYGTGEYNLRPCEARGRAWGRRAAKGGALAVSYTRGAAAGARPPLQRRAFPHTKEHEMHRRVRNPANAGVTELSAIHGKRLLREVQYHLGQSFRFYLIDGVFGSDVATGTPYRIITDNPTHAYFASLAAIRKQNYVAQQEIMLVKRVTQSPIDEWGWRRPGVLVYHAPAYDFEAPRIVEEFGGPRPSDMGLTSGRFVAVEPYSIPMKGILAGDGSCDLLLQTTGLLCARWGFYADDAGLVTVPGESVLSPDGATLTLFITGAATDADVLRASPHLYGSRHHRLGGDVLARAWDVVALPAAGTAPAALDLVELDEGRVQRPLPTRLGLPAAVSHRMYGRRHVSGYGYKRPHRYTDDAASRAYAGGHLFNGPATGRPRRPPPRGRAAYR